MEEKKKIWTVGYSKFKTPTAFVSHLKKLNIQFLIDVRSYPVCKWEAAYCKDNLNLILAEAGIKYAHFAALGGKPLRDDLYLYDGGYPHYTNIGGQRLYINRIPNYAAMANEPAYIRDISRIENGTNAGHVICMMCSEGNASGCHRSKLIGKSLIAKGFNVVHL